MLLNELQVKCILAATASRELLTRRWLLDAMTVTNGFDVTVKHEGSIKPGDIFDTPVDDISDGVKPGAIVGINDDFTGSVLENNDGVLTVAVLGSNKNPVFHRLDVFAYNPALFKQYLGVNACTDSMKSGPLVDSKSKTLLYGTTLGRWLENMYAYQFPTDFKVYPYYNSVMDPKDIVKRYTKTLLDKKITVKSYKSFVDNFFFLNHITEICVPGLTERSLMTNPKVAEVKKKFIAEHKDQMHDPLVIKQLEDELVALDKEWLGKGTDHEDPSVTFFDGLGNKSYNMHRKKLFLTTGGIPAFDAVGKYDFIENSLDEGWTIKAIPSLANEARKGSYERGVETAKGGAETKLVMRVFQDLAISVDDCGTKRTIKLDFANTCNIKDFIGRTIRVGGADILLTEDNIAKYDGKVLDVYSPLTCEAKDDLCFKCCGQRARDLYSKIIGVQVVNITSKFMQTAMKNMHGTELKIISPKLEDILL